MRGKWRDLTEARHPVDGSAGPSPRGPVQTMVLPVRIELTTSALPRMRSTTELRQHVGRMAGLMAKRFGPVNPLASGRREY
jgi:hypothetical protein